MNLSIFNLRDAANCNRVKRTHYRWNLERWWCVASRKALIFRPGLDLHSYLINGALFLTRIRSPWQAAEPATQRNRKRWLRTESQMDFCFLLVTLHTIGWAYGRLGKEVTKDKSWGFTWTVHPVPPFAVGRRYSLPGGPAQLLPVGWGAWAW